MSQVFYEKGFENALQNIFLFTHINSTYFIWQEYVVKVEQQLQADFKCVMDSNLSPSDMNNKSITSASENSWKVISIQFMLITMIPFYCQIRCYVFS